MITVQSTARPFLICYNCPTVFLKVEVKEPTDVAAESEEESEESEESEEESDSEENDDDSDSEEESDDEESKTETVWERIQVGFLNLNYQRKIERITNIYNLASDIKIF